MSSTGILGFDNNEFMILKSELCILIETGLYLINLLSTIAGFSNSSNDVILSSAPDFTAKAHVEDLPLA